MYADFWIHKPNAIVTTYTYTHKHTYTTDPCARTHIHAHSHTNKQTNIYTFSLSRWHVAANRLTFYSGNKFIYAPSDWDFICTVISYGKAKIKERKKKKRSLKSNSSLSLCVCVSFPSNCKMHKTKKWKICITVFTSKMYIFHFYGSSPCIRYTRLSHFFLVIKHDDIFQHTFLFSSFLFPNIFFYLTELN